MAGNVQKMNLTRNAPGLLGKLARERDLPENQGNTITVGSPTANVPNRADHPNRKVPRERQGNVIHVKFGR